MYNGRHAWERYHERRYDILLMDLRMPEMDGAAATRAIRELEAKQNLPRVPILGLTAGATEEDQETIISAGCDDLLVKPVAKQALSRKMLQMLG